MAGSWSNILPTTQSDIPYDYLACCLQGGGAMGAYQVGVLQALQEANYYPNWFVGTSIGAINSAISAGNPKEERIEKLKEFWKTIATTSWIDDQLLPNDVMNRSLYNFISSQITLLFGQPGFFTPRWTNPFINWTIPQLSYYDTSPLRQTLERFVDFDRINNSVVRLSVGAVEVSTGAVHYFDSEQVTITADHIMASGALPPGFPPVEIDGMLYWDGGLSSNTPVNYVLNNHRPQAMLCFMVHLFDSFGLEPTNLDDVEQRKKDIVYSSRFERSINMHHEIHKLRYKLHQLALQLPKTAQDNNFIQKCLNSGWNKTVSLVRFLYQHDSDDLSSKDYEFSTRSIREHIQKGYEDGTAALEKSPWLEPTLAETGIDLYDMAGITANKEGT